MHLWRVPELEGLELGRATYTTHSFGRHAHDALAIGVIETGVGEFWCHGATQRAPRDSLVLIGAGDVHTGGAARDSVLTYRMVYAPPGLLGRFLPQQRHGDPPRFAQHTAADAALARRLRAAHDALRHPSAGLAEQSALVAVLQDVLVRYGRWQPADDRTPSDARLAGRLREYLHAHLERRVSLAELSDVVARHPAYLNRVFARVVGLPPHAYLTQIRVERAKLLLQAGRRPADVATATGFADQSHLTRAFKRLVGAAPGRYQRDVADLKNVQAPQAGAS